MRARRRCQQVLVRLSVCVLAAFGAGACGSAVGYQPVSAAGVEESGSPGPGHSAPDLVPEPETEPDWPYESASPGPLPLPDPEPVASPTPSTPVRTEVSVPTTTTPPKPARSIQPKPDECDWNANLERATLGRVVDWIIQDTGAWGRAEVPGTRIWIAPRTPCDKVYSVAVHEWTHHMQGVVYGDWGVVRRELAPYGGAEVVADCGALLLGATWIKYGCAAQRSRDAAAAILRGERP